MIESKHKFNIIKSIRYIIVKKTQH